MTNQTTTRQREILVIEDDETLRESLNYTLGAEGFKVRAIADGLEGLRAAQQNEADAIVLDIMLPGMDGLEICRRIRRSSQVPIIMLTARREEIDKVVGLEVGADDYLTKPFSMRELVARVKALIRRANAVPVTAAEGAVLTSGNLSIDLRRREVRRDGDTVRLNPKEFDLLAFFVRNTGQAFERERLLDRVWGYEFGGGSRTVDVHVRWLREKIELEPAHPTRIQTVRGVGYRFEG